MKIGEKAFQGQRITPADIVRISGKVDKDLEIKLKRMEIGK